MNVNELLSQLEELELRVKVAEQKIAALQAAQQSAQSENSNA